MSYEDCGSPRSLKTQSLSKGEAAHLIRLNNLLVFAAFLRAFGTLESIDSLPSGEIDGLNATLCQQAINGLRITIGSHTTALCCLGEVAQHIGHDKQGIRFGGSDQTNRTAFRPTSGIQALSHLAILCGGQNAPVFIGQCGAAFIIGNTKRRGGLVAYGVIDGLNGEFLEFAGSVHGSIRIGMRALNTKSGHFAVFAEDFHRGGIEMNVVSAVGRVAFKVNIAVIFHIFGHFADDKELFNHLTGELILAGLFDGLLIKLEILFVDDELHARELLHLTQFLHRELGLRHATTDEQMQFLGLILADSFVHVVWNIGTLFQIVGIAHKLTRHIHGHITAADNGNRLGIQRPFASAGWITVIPFHEFGSAMYTFEIRARKHKRIVFHCTCCEKHGIIACKQVFQHHILAEFDIGIEVNIRIIQCLFQGICDEFDAWVVRGHAIANQSKWHRKLFKYIDASLGAQSQFLTGFAQLTQEYIRGIHSCRARSYYCNPQFFRILLLLLSHAFHTNANPANVTECEGCDSPQLHVLPPVEVSLCDLL
ncbi:hypothetical protein BITS_1303 [Bifidobacterium tsurumiense]|uniref:Uncharacterized protein n=1 Tax=Bifidobacterium tsurumiense TaxID=356829 RepID=A0A087E9I7_9BIFI|nr:hypothetical protein BITS_1303 [Bifidobacterium tsurumiense]